MSALRLRGGELLVDPDTAALIGQLVDIALQTSAGRRLWQTDDDPHRAQRLRNLYDATGGSDRGSAIGTPERHDDVDLPQSNHRTTVSVREASDMLGITPRRVTDLARACRLHGHQDAPGGHWRIYLDAVHDRLNGA